MTQMSAAREGRITPEMQTIAENERMDIDLLRQRVANGEIAIMKNRVHDVEPVAVGKGLKTKVNANIGTSTDLSDIMYEVEKAQMAIDVGADAIMDLSTGGDLIRTRKTIMREVPAIIGTVPIYQAVVNTVQNKGALVDMTADDLFDVLEEQAAEGVDFFTVHCGVTRNSIDRLRHQGRLTDIVSRGGSFLTTWIIANNEENPLYTQFDRLLDIVREYDVVLSLGDGMRPGCLADATDRAQIEELLILGELTQRAWKKDVQVMIEGPGHVPINQIKTNMQIQKRLCQNAPFYVLGPLVTDVAPGYDHITSAIGGAIAGSAGADFLCYVTPSEHLKLPDLEEVRQGVIATRIAGHAADIAKELPGAAQWDEKMAQARKNLDWDEQLKLAMDPQRAREIREKGKPETEDVCSMCGEYCAIKLVNESLNSDMSK